MDPDPEDPKICGSGARYPILLCLNKSLLFVQQGGSGSERDPASGPAARPCAQRPAAPQQDSHPHTRVKVRHPTKYPAA